MEENSNQYDYCPLCGQEWEEHNDIECCKKNFMSYVKIADKTKLKIMAESFDEVITKAKKEVFDDIGELLFNEPISEKASHEIEKLKLKHLNTNNPKEVKE